MDAWTSMANGDSWYLNKFIFIWRQVQNDKSESILFLFWWLSIRNNNNWSIKTNNEKEDTFWWLFSNLGDQNVRLLFPANKLNFAFLRKKTTVEIFFHLFFPPLLLWLHFMTLCLQRYFSMREWKKWMSKSRSCWPV